MSKYCILLTMEYPFYQGESFIENEINYLSEAFDQVYIFALSAHGKQTRITPKNVESYSLKNNTSKMRYLQYGLQGVFPFGKIGMKEIFPIETMKVLLASLYARGRINTSYKKIISTLDLKLRLECPTFVVFYSYWFMDQALLACLLRERYQQSFQTKVISRAHGYDLYESRNKSNTIPFRDLVFKKIDKVFPCSKDGADYLIQKYPQWKEKVQVAYLGTIDYGMQIIQNKQDQVFHIVTCSNLIPLKRIHLVAEALGMLKSRKIENIHWTCIGDGPEMPRILSIISDNKIASQVTVRGRLSNKEVIEFYKSSYCDLFINVSTSEGLPVSLMEVQSFGIPALATDVGGTREIINNTCGELLTKELTKEILAEKIKKYSSLSNTNVCILRENARQNWLKNFNANRNYSSFLSLLV